MAGRKIILTLCLSCISLLAGAQAQEDEATLNLEAVVMTGTRTEKRLSESPVLTTVVSGREVEKAAALSFLETLEDNIPGIVSEPNAMGNNLRIRGLNSRYILFLVDGERLVSEGAGGNVNLDQVDVNSIKRVEIINGAASALYGSNAVGAVINIITKEPQEHFNTTANITYQSYNTLNARVSAETVSGHLKAMASAFRNSSDRFGGNGSGAYAAKYGDWGGNLKLGWGFGERSDLSLTGRWFHHESFNPEGSLNTTHPLTNTLSGGLSGGYASADGRYQLRLSASLDKYFDSDWYEQLASSKLANTATYMSARALNTFKPNSVWEIVGGVELNREENYSVKTLGPEPTSKAVNDGNLFAQAQWTALPGFDLVAGARGTLNDMFGSVLTPKLSAMYRISRFTFRAGSGLSFRAPSIKELYYNFDHQGMFWVYGNPDLQAEKGLYNSVSAEYTAPILNASVTAYRNDIGNKITQYDVVNASGGLEKYYKNVDSATLQGVDFNLSCILWKHLFVKGSYSFCDAVDNATGLQLQSNVKHSGTVSFTWNGQIKHSPFSLQLAGHLSSPRLYQSDEETSQSKPYNVWKAIFMKPFRVGDGKLELTLKCDNLFGFKDPTFINPGRQYLIGLRYSFK